jgi:glutathione S-transferase
MALTLVIGNKNYSSWSLRPWLAMKMAGIAFDEIRIPLDHPETRATILQYSPTGRVPCLIDERADGELTVWDSLAICEYINEAYASGALWPADAGARARARSVVAEMHSGFSALRSHLPMDIRSSLPGRGAGSLALVEVADDIARIETIWSEALARSGGPFLFGEFSIADAYYAPVVTRFHTYAVPLPAELSAYVKGVRATAPMQEWIAAAEEEAEVIAQ